MTTFSRDPFTGSFLLPTNKGLVETLFRYQGNLLLMLRALVDDTPESEAVRQQLLFEMLFNLKNTPEEKDWNILLDIYKQRAVAIAESNLLNSISA